MMRQNELQNDRIAYWGNAYLKSTEESYQQARVHFRDEHWFTAYLYLFVSFNNLYSLYSLVVRSAGHEPKKIRDAIARIPDKDIESIYTAEYFRYLIELNERTPEQFLKGPDAGLAHHGIVNMRDYFLGKEPNACVAYLPEIASVDAGAEEKRQTIKELAAILLYTVRNNQFHAIKGSRNLADDSTLWQAYNLLEPVVKALLRVGVRKIEAATKNR